jgi:hypothetical protein
MSELRRFRQGLSTHFAWPKETLLGGEWRVLSLRALPPGIGRGVNCPPPGRGALAQPGGRSWPSRKQLGCTVCTVLFIQCTLYKLLTVHPTGFNCFTLCTLLLEHSRMFQYPNHSKQPSAVSFKCTVFSFQLSAFSFQPLAFGLWPLAFGLWPLAFGLWPLAFGLWPLAFSRAGP